MFKKLSQFLPRQHIFSNIRVIILSIQISFHFIKLISYVYYLILSTNTHIIHNDFFNNSRYIVISAVLHHLLLCQQYFSRFYLQLFPTFILIFTDGSVSPISAGYSFYIPEFHISYSNNLLLTKILHRHSQLNASP